MPIPVRLKTRLARRPAQDSETGVFKAIPSSATHAAMEASDEGFDVEEEQREFSRGQGVGGNRTVFIGMVFALVAAVAGVVAYAVQANSLSKQVKDHGTRRARGADAGGGKHAGLSRAAGSRQAGAADAGSRLDAAAAVARPLHRRLGRQVQPVHDHASRRSTAGSSCSCGAWRATRTASCAWRSTRRRSGPATTWSGSTATTGAGRRKNVGWLTHRPAVTR